MNSKMKMVLWAAAVALGTYIIVNKVPALRSFVYGVPASEKTPTK
jgi:hypothetical protein